MGAWPSAPRSSRRQTTARYGQSSSIWLARAGTYGVAAAPLTGQMVGNPRRADLPAYGVIQRTARCGGVHQQVRAVNQKVIQTLDTQAAQRIVNGAAQVSRLAL